MLDGPVPLALLACKGLSEVAQRGAQDGAEQILRAGGVGLLLMCQTRHDR